MTHLSIAELGVLIRECYAYLAYLVALAVSDTTPEAIRRDAADQVRAALAILERALEAWRA